MEHIIVPIAIIFAFIVGCVKSAMIGYQAGLERGRSERAQAESKEDGK
jgi:hypothetical protein